MAVVEELKIRVSAELGDSNSSINRLVNALEKLGTVTQKTNKETERSNENANKAISGYNKVANAMRRILFRRAVVALIREVGKALGEGIQTMYEWSQLHDKTFANTMDSFATEMTYIRDALGAAVAPMITALMPALIAIGDAFVDLINDIQQFFQALNGSNTWQKAVKSSTTYAQMLGKSADNQKALNHQLMQFDELNNITTPSSRGSDSKIGGNYETAYVSADVQKSANVIRQVLDKLTTAFQGFFAKIDFDMLNAKALKFVEVFGGIFLSISDFLANEGVDLGEVVNCILGLVLDIATEIARITKDSMPIALSIAKDIFGVVENIYYFFSNLFSGNFTGAWKNILKLLANVGSVVGKVFGGVIQSVGNLIVDIRVFLGQITEEEGQKIKDKNNFVKNVDESLQSVLQDIDNIGKESETTADKFARDMKKIQDGISVGFRDATTGVITWCNTADQLAAYYGNNFGVKYGQNVANAIKNTLNNQSVFQSLQNPFLNPTISSFVNQKYGFNAFADGGFPDMGSMFIAGEAGAEMVGTINGRTGVASGQEITGIADAIYSTSSSESALLRQIASAIINKDLTISPSAKLGKVVNDSAILYKGVSG